MELTRWKLVAGGAALVGITTGGLAAANADDGFDLNDRGGVIELIDETQGADDTDGSNLVLADDSPESPDSPNESAEESPDSPFDSPDDEGFVGAVTVVDDSPDESPEDSPATVVDDSPDSPDESPEDSPATAPAADDSPDSPDSLDS